MRIGFVAEPWWVNLAVLIPVGAYLFWRRHPTGITARLLIVLCVFAIAFGFLEATVVVYLRAASGLLPGYPGLLSDVASSAPQSQLLREVPPSLLSFEVLREAATILMLISIALLAPGKAKSRLAAFLWAFAIWDIIYYVSLWALIRWPQSSTDRDVLFLIPVPWFAPVWFPVLVSLLTVLAVLLTRARSEGKS
jgi:hypothetical protein